MAKILYCIISIILLDGVLSARSTVRSLWDSYKKMHKKNYSVEEEVFHRIAWMKYLEAMIVHNMEYDLGMQTYRMGLTQFSDMDSEEVTKHHTGYKPSNSTPDGGYMFKGNSNMSIPEEVDWQKDGYVTSVKDQGRCGACYAFAALGPLEAQHKKKNGELISLSAQNILDCSDSEGNHGCSGGMVVSSYSYVKKNDGIDAEHTYPYKAKHERCRFKRNSATADIRGYVLIQSRDEQALMQALAHVGPISVPIDGSLSTFHNYRSGIFNDRRCSADNHNHAVTLVGYGTDEHGRKYWLAKNSWGRTWGENGYVRFSRDIPNICGIAFKPSYPLM